MIVLENRCKTSVLNVWNYCITSGKKQNTESCHEMAIRGNYYPSLKSFITLQAKNTFKKIVVNQSSNRYSR